MFLFQSAWGLQYVYQPAFRYAIFLQFNFMNMMETENKLK